MFSLVSAWGEFDSCQESGDGVNLDDFDEELEGRDIDDEGPAHGLRAHETVEPGPVEIPWESVGSPQAQFFELVKGLCGTPLCGLPDDHLGLCANQVVVSKRRDDSANRLMSPDKHVGSQIV